MKYAVTVEFEAKDDKTAIEVGRMLAGGAVNAAIILLTRKKGPTFQIGTQRLTREDRELWKQEAK